MTDKSDKSPLRTISFETPLGWMVVAESGEGIALVDFLGRDRPSEDGVISAVSREYPDAELLPGEGSELLWKTRRAILAYLTDRIPPPRIKLDLRKGTVFDRRVWKQLETIAFGSTKSYGQIAAELKDSGASRAVGGACGRNPVPILIPCHRVVGSKGKLGGYSGGLDIKRALLNLEKSA